MGIAHRFFIDLEAVRQSQRVSIRVLELDEVCHVPFKTLLPASGAPIDACRPKLRLPLGKFVNPTDVKSNVVEQRLGSRARGNSVLVTIRPDIRNLSVRRRSGGKSQYFTGKVREPFAIRHADADLHDIVDSRHRGPPW